MYVNNMNTHALQCCDSKDCVGDGTFDGTPNAEAVPVRRASVPIVKRPAKRTRSFNWKCEVVSGGNRV